MTTTRRDFFGQCLAAGGTLAIGLCGCAGDAGGRGCGSPGGATVPSGKTSAKQAAAPAPIVPGEAGYLKLEQEGELAGREAALWSILESCRLCPRACGVNRIAGERGVCSSTAQLRIASSGPHYGEEPPLVGTGGSGTIFFSNCNLLCIFCQNYTINHLGEGHNRTVDELAEMMLTLQRRGCHNINLVTPTHVVPHIVKALRIAIKGGLKLPLVYNTGGYDSLEALQLLDGVVDIYLPDYKYQESAIADRLSTGAADYPEVAAVALREMQRQTGYMVEEGGVARRGLMVRHLVLPNNQAGTDRFVKFVAEDLGKDTYVNIMAQYRPLYRAHEFEEVSRRITGSEMRKALGWAQEAGLTRIRT